MTTCFGEECSKTNAAISQKQPSSSPQTVSKQTYNKQNSKTKEKTNNNK